MAQNRPNVIIITPDELRADYVGCFQRTLPLERQAEGAAHLVETPHIDGLAEQGVIFTQAFMQHTKCGPSRSSMFTGQYPSSGGHRTLHLLLQPGERHLAETFRRHGYTTVLVGRNHIVQDSFLDDSFNTWLHHPVAEPTDYPETLGDPLTGAFYRGCVQTSLSETTDGRNTKATIEWLRRRSHDKPFFLWFNLFYPHPPYQVPEPFFSSIAREKVNVYPPPNFKDKPAAMSLIYQNYSLDRLGDGEWREIIATYGGMVAAVDTLVGELLAAVREEELMQDTIVVFTTDHGDYAGEHRLVEKWDTLFHDCLLRTPFILVGPSLKKRGVQVDAMVEMVDLAPTLYKLCDLTPHPGIVGKSLLPLISDPDSTHRTSIYAEGGREDELLMKHNPYHYSQGRPLAYAAKYKVFFDDPYTLGRAVMVRTRDHKLVFRLHGVNELYDLQKDPGETVNRYDEPSYANVIRELEQLCIARLLQAQPRLPEVARPGV